MSFFAKCLLVSTSLSPVLGAVAISQFESGAPWTTWVWWLVAGICLVGMCWALLKYAARNLETDLLYIQEFERRDQEMLTFLFIYLLPFLRSADPTFANNWLTGIYILAIIILAIAHAGAFHFNPVMRLFFGYRFYSVRGRNGVSNLLISRMELRKTGEEVRTVGIAQNVYLFVGDSNARKLPPSGNY